MTSRILVRRSIESKILIWSSARSPVPFARTLGAGEDLLTKLLVANPARMLRLGG